MSFLFNTDQNLYKKLQAGDEKAFLYLFDKYNRLLYALSYRYLKSSDDAEDAVQYTFMKLWERRESLSLGDNIKSLLFTILKNYILNELRHHKIILEKHYEIASNSQIEDDSFLHRLEETDLKKHLYRIIHNLPTQKRTICLLKIEKNLTNQEIATEMNLSIATVKSHYTQAIKMLRTEIECLSIAITALISVLCENELIPFI